MSWIVGVELEGQRFEHLHREDAVAAVVLGQVGLQQKVLQASEDAVADVLVERHPALSRGAFLKHATAEHDVGFA